MKVNISMYLAQTHDDKWHILDMNHEIVGRFDTQQAAMDEVTKLMGRDDWEHVVVKETPSNDRTAPTLRRHSSLLVSWWMQLHLVKCHRANIRP